ncbi:MAG: hypothetical protein NT170_01200 [Candidatus Moranbacteria bacterium]|nr:hypothetical protein [Candidatus Moranbacteria bacterium]
MNKEKLLNLMRQLAEARGEAEIKDIDKQIKYLLGKDMGPIYKRKDKLNCHAALDFLKAAEKSFSALAGDLGATAENLDAKDTRQPVLYFLQAMAERFAGEAKEAHDTIDKINRF